MWKSAIVGTIFFILTVSTYADHLDLDSYRSIESIKNIELNSIIQSHLKAVLLEDYSTFSQNFEEYAVPYSLKTARALYYEGRLKNFTAYSAATIYEDGRLFAARLNQKTNTLWYFTNDASCSTALHPTIQVFSKYAHHPKVIYASAGNPSVLRFNLNQETTCTSYPIPSKNRNRVANTSSH